MSPSINIFIVVFLSVFIFIGVFISDVDACRIVVVFILNRDKTCRSRFTVRCNDEGAQYREPLLFGCCAVPAQQMNRFYEHQGRRNGQRPWRRINRK